MLPWLSELFVMISSPIYLQLFSVLCLIFFGIHPKSRNKADINARLKISSYCLTKKTNLQNMIKFFSLFVLWKLFHCEPFKRQHGTYEIMSSIALSKKKKSVIFTLTLDKIQGQNIESYICRVNFTTLYNQNRAFWWNDWING